MAMESNISIRLFLEPRTLRSYEFNTYLITIGRGLDRDIDVDCHFISRRHCCIYVDDKGFYVLKDGDLLDNKSKNGVYINGDRVLNESRIKENDIITFSEAIFFPRIIILQAANPPDEEITAIYKN